MVQKYFFSTPQKYLLLCMYQLAQSKAVDAGQLNNWKTVPAEHCVLQGLCCATPVLPTLGSAVPPVLGTQLLSWPVFSSRERGRTPPLPPCSSKGVWGMGTPFVMVIQPPSLTQALSAAPARTSPAFHIWRWWKDTLSLVSFSVSKREKAPPSSVGWRTAYLVENLDSHLPESHRFSAPIGKLALMPKKVENHSGV